MVMPGELVNDRRAGEQMPLFEVPPAVQPGAPMAAQAPRSAASRGKASATKTITGKGRGAARDNTKTRTSGRGQAYLFRVVLKWDRKVWRTIEVRGDQTLDDLHLAIQDAFGWDNDHLYAFFMSGKRWDQATEYTDPRAEDGRLADRARIGALRLEPKKRFLYLFDYGDELLHDVWLVSVGPAAPGARYPRIVKVHGETLPQYPSDDGE